MKKARMILICLLVVVCREFPGWAAAIPSPLQGITTSVTVRKETITGIFTYRYRVSSSPSNNGQIRGVDIEISRGPGDVVLSGEGLVNGPRYSRHSSEDAFQRVPMVPVGISGPEGWTSDLGFDNNTPPRGFAGWGSIDQPFRILPGRTLEGFQLMSRGLPAIRAVKIQPAIDWANVPEEFSDPEKARELRDSLIFSTNSVGPKAPPQNFVPVEFLNYLISLLHDSRELGWIKVEGIHKSLLAKLLEAKRALEKDQTNVTKNTLNAFLNEVRATSCQEFSCPGNKPLTSEAYALLFFNGQFLFERLP